MDGHGSVALLVVVVVVAVDAWVLLDARAREAGGHAVAATVGPITLATPAQWFLGCLILWVLVVPLYLVARRE
jgi:hypothetical protein